MDYWASANGGGIQKTAADAPDYWGQANGVAPPQKPPAQPKQEGWGEWIGGMIKGRTDPAYGDLPSVYSQFPNALDHPMVMGATFGASDAQLGDIVQSNLGDKFVRREQDANGHDVFVTRGQNGEEQKGYLNRPGLDSEDVVRGVRGAIPYALTGGAAGAAMRGAGLGVQALVQAASAGATSVAGDVAQMPLGSEQGIESGKALVATGAGAAGPAIGAAAGSLWRRFVTIPGLVDKTTGQLTQKGIEAARKTGIDPADITPNFSKRFAQSFANSGDAEAAAADAGLQSFGIPATKGQLTKDPYLLTKEEAMRRRLYGERAQDTMRAFDKKQEEAIANAAFADDPSRITGIGYNISSGRKPGSVPADRQPSVLGGNIKDAFTQAKAGARSQEEAAWKGTRDLAPTQGAFDILPDVLNKKLGDVFIDEQLTPAAARMGKEIDAFIKGEAPEKVAGVFKQAPVKSLDQMRRRLLGAYKSAATSEDARAARAVYDGFNDWIGESAQQQLLQGDPAAAMQIVKARGFTREVRELFSPTNPDGSRSAAAARLKKIANADSGEAVINALFGSHGSRGVSEGSVQALQNFKATLDRFAPYDVAKQAWGDVRLAHWTRLVTGRNGEMLGPQAMMSNIKSAIQSQSSVFKVLYTPAQQRTIAWFARTLERVAYKPPNASGSGYTAATFATEGIMKLLDSFGLGTPVRAGIEYSGFGRALNAAQARNAVRSFTRPPRPNVTPAVTGAVSGYVRENQ